ncbi:hypothetical protein FGO68_gene15014 [Halteria grandinella]|uniref:Uncharacterized protein n=1 Tax=Halteria grandinella TaxID=5974 RepID=A0A8J8NPB0_HALGN|nr:hypothetical protein FGO68_gene15014 [Halteria grandinella]
MQSRKSIKTLKFSLSNFLGNFTIHCPKVYPSVETLIYDRSNFIDSAEYSQYENLKVLKILNCTIYSVEVDENQKNIYTKICYGATIDLLKKLIYKQSETSAPQNTFNSRLKVLEADVYFGTDLQPDNNQPWHLITSIESCKMRDYDTIYSFSMIHTLLRSTASIENASSLPPIQLEIYKFKESDKIFTLDSQQCEQALRNIAEQQGLIIYAYEEVCSKENYTIYIINIRLKSLEGRQLRLEKRGAFYQ